MTPLSCELPLALMVKSSSYVNDRGKRSEWREMGEVVGMSIRVIQGGDDHLWLSSFIMPLGPEETRRFDSSTAFS